MSSPKTSGTKTQTAGKNQQHTPLDQLRTPLLAALGAGNLAGQAVVDAVGKAKERVAEGGETARKNMDELPTDIESLRGKLDPAELRKAIDEYTEAALKLYSKLAESGEQALDKILSQPQLKRTIEQLEGAARTAQDRFDDVAGETRGRVDDVLGKVTKRTRSTGEKAARTVQQVAGETAEKVQEVAGDAAEKVQEAGDDLAHETRSASRKAANRTAPATRRSTTPANAKKPAGGTTGTTGKSTK
ncbi:hypothetical protein CFN78_26800 [Amycolatopsis antarctica]|uniref:Heparin-binding hemagglutinin n=1 Tax=Amycolatopsis antarctica TaxID=1854586 RepID=A0A263CW35_9PSEU|nr:hypothetical protein [Amycolatopsis antarctica]OZM70179.1 hypothetical protein CFN78_26800 [Amycolatopsis antarctica]